MFACDWCSERMERAWQIPSGKERSKAKWVCKECHSCYFDDDCDHTKRREDRVI